MWRPAPHAALQSVIIFRSSMRLQSCVNKLKGNTQPGFTAGWCWGLSCVLPQPSCLSENKIKGQYITGTLPFFKPLVSLLKPSVKKTNWSFVDLDDKRTTQQMKDLSFLLPVSRSVGADWECPGPLGEWMMLPACSPRDWVVTHADFIQRQTQDLRQKSRQGG